MPDTITESELTAMKNEFIADSKYPYATPDAMRYALKHVGITVVPDLIPEPEGDVILVDRLGNHWTPYYAQWRIGDSTAARPWDEVVHDFGPVKIYRLEES